MINFLFRSSFLTQKQQPFVFLVDKILTAKAQDPNADTSKLEAKIDQLVYQLYNLTDDEITIIECD